MLECDSNPWEALTLHTSVLQQQNYFQVGINVTDDGPNANAAKNSDSHTSR